MMQFELYQGKKMPEKVYKTRKKTITKKTQKSRRITDGVSKAKHGQKMTKTKKIEKKVTKKGGKKSKTEKKQKKIISQFRLDRSIPIFPTASNTQSDSIIPQVPITRSIPETQIVPSGRSNPSDHYWNIIQKTNLLTILSFLSIILFFVGGYFYPATSEDIASNNVIWAGNDGKYDRGLFSQFYASIAFTFGVILLGYYVNATFIRFNIKDWNYFLIGILLMFFFGLGKIGELIFNHNIFEGFKNLILPVAIIILAFATYKIYKNMAGGI